MQSLFVQDREGIVGPGYSNSIGITGNTMRLRATQKHFSTAWQRFRDLTIRICNKYV